MAKGAIMVTILIRNPIRQGGEALDGLWTAFGGCHADGGQECKRKLPHRQSHDRFLNVQPVLGLVKGCR